MDKTLKIKENTHSRLKTYGSKGESFDDIINMLADVYDREVLGVRK